MRLTDPQKEALKRMQMYPNDIFYHRRDFGSYYKAGGITVNPRTFNALLNRWLVDYECEVLLGVKYKLTELGLKEVQ